MAKLSYISNSDKLKSGIRLRLTAGGVYSEKELIGLSI